MELQNLIIGFFSIIGVIIVLIVIYYLLRRYYETAKPTKTFPSPQFMKYVGAQCPDYWEAIENKDGTVTCKNYSGLNVVNKDNEFGCGDCTNQQIFDRITEWPLNKKNMRVGQRCLWKKCCAYKNFDGNNIPIPWIGLENSC